MKIFREKIPQMKVKASQYLLSMLNRVWLLIRLDPVLYGSQYRIILSKRDEHSHNQKMSSGIWMNQRVFHRKLLAMDIVFAPLMEMKLPKRIHALVK